MSISPSEKEKQLQRDALLHESYCAQSGMTHDGPMGSVKESSGAFAYVNETVGSFKQESKYWMG